jgi:hypothetical protein
VIVAFAPFVLIHQNGDGTILQSSPPLQQLQHRTQTMDILPKVLVIYFPQFHSDTLNDKLWGDNFTDWDNLKKAPVTNKLGYPLPHPLPYDPNISSDRIGRHKSGLGYYNLRSQEIRRHQSNLARSHHIDGFIYHHYWFYDPSHPGPNLHVPLLDMLNDGYPNLPFFLNWCAVQWVNVWMGRPKFQSKDAKINRNNALLLQAQYFNATDVQIKEHYDWLRPFFLLKNYIKVRGEPVFFVYQWDKKMHRILESLRQFAIDDGFPGLYIIIGRGGPPPHIHDSSGLDDGLLGLMKRKTQSIDSFPATIFNQTMVYPYPSDFINKPHVIPNWCGQKGQIPSYPSPQNKPEIYSIPLTFDNTPRREFDTASQWNYGAPDDVVSFFRASLESALTFDTCCWEDSHKSVHKEERFFVINAWNEWAEGMAMEPSDVFGMRFLETVKEVKEGLAERLFGKGRQGCELSMRRSVNRTRT